MYIYIIPIWSKKPKEDARIKTEWWCQEVYQYTYQ